VPRPARVDFDARSFVTGTTRALDAIRLVAEAHEIKVGQDVAAKVRAAWPVGDARTRRKVAGQHTRDGITCTHRYTAKGRLVVEIRIPFPAAFDEFGTRHQPPRPKLRPAMAAARAQLAEL